MDHVPGNVLQRYTAQQCLPVPEVVRGAGGLLVVMNYRQGQKHFNKPVSYPSALIILILSVRRDLLVNTIGFCILTFKTETPLKGMSFKCMP